MKTIYFSEFNLDMVKDYIGIILSGSELNVSSFYYNEKLYEGFKPLINFIQNNTELPILAICFGLHLVAYASGAQICRMQIEGLGERMLFILMNETDELITYKNIPVNAYHLDFVSPNDCELQNQFKILSTSKTRRYKMIQYMKHLDKPIYAIQFHPETHNPYYFRPDEYEERIIEKTRRIGEEIIENFLWFCSYKKNNPEETL